jgi:hypothetical protein
MQLTVSRMKVKGLAMAILLEDLIRESVNCTPLYPYLARCELSVPSPIALFIA